MDLATFRSHYANSGGSVECVVILRYETTEGLTGLTAEINSISSPTQEMTLPTRYLSSFLMKRVLVSKRCESTRYCKSSCSSTHPIIRLVGILEEKSIQRGIIIFPGNMTPSARKASSRPRSLGLILTCFLGHYSHVSAIPA